MSTVVSFPQSIIPMDKMYAAFARQTQYPLMASPKASPQFSRRCAAQHHSPSPSRDRTRDKSPRVLTPKANYTAKVNSSLNSCQLCHENQASLINAVAKLSICDSNGQTEDINRNNNMKPLAPTAAIATPELADSLQGPVPPLIVDCRSFIAYNLCHVRGAINIGCADRVTKRRLQSGKICVADLIKCSQAREQFRNNVDSEIVVYDDDTTEITECAGSSNNSLNLILKALLKNGKKVHFLKGGLAEFHARFEHLCNKSKPPASAPLYSPTTPIISNEIDTAVASRVLPFLYIGNERDASNRERLQELGITHILNVTSHIPFYFEESACLTYKRLQASDSGSQNLKQYFADAISFIDDVQKAGGKVLVHCQAGVSRSATITIAYLLKHSNMSMTDAFKFVKNCRPIAAPNFNFMGQLMEYEKCLNGGDVTRDLSVDIGIQSKV